MNENEINRLTEDTLNSINDLKRSEPDERLFQKIMTGVGENERSFLRENNITAKYAIAFAVLILINIFSFFSYKSSEENIKANYSLYNSKSVNSFVKEFFSEPEDYSYYK